MTFLTKFLRAYLATESIDHLSLSLRKGGVANLIQFFPSSRQTQVELANHFKAEALPSVLEFYMKQKNGQAKEETLYRLKELVADEADNREVSTPLSLSCVPLFELIMTASIVDYWLSRTAEQTRDSLGSRFCCSRLERSSLLARYGITSRSID